MDHLAGFDSPTVLALACLAGLLAGVVKGAVGFAMPMILISSLSMLLSPDLALAALILPTLVTNGMQALRQGISAALTSVLRFRVFLVAGLVMLVLSAQLVTRLSQEALFLLIGGPICLFSVMQLLGWRPRLSGPSGWAEALIGGFAGFVGGLSGVWGPPTVAYLTAIDTPKADQMRAQGVIYGLGAVALALAHIQSGVLSAETAPLSALMVLPAVAGMWIGSTLHDRIDQRTFRRATLVVLLLAGLNLIRRAVL